MGFSVAFAYPVRFSSFSLLVAWLAKWVVLKVGGIDLYRRARVAVLGVLAGYTTGVVISRLVDLLFFFGQGHPVHPPDLSGARVFLTGRRSRRTVLLEEVPNFRGVPLEVPWPDKAENTVCYSV